MSTHNLLLRLGESTFLEVIAPNRSAPGPDRARWFALDDVHEPRLAAWVARTDDLRGVPASVRAGLGEIELMTRGAREWLITIPSDGALPLGGAAPALIEWRAPRRPAGATLADAGCALQRLAVRHPQADRVSALLAALGLAGAVDVESGAEVGLSARIVTPAGQRTLA